MKTRAFVSSILAISLLLTVFVSNAICAEDNAPQRPPQRGPMPGGRGLFGDWNLKVKFGEWEMDAILSFSRDEEGSLTADWISFWGVNKLQDVKFEEGKLSFVQEIKFGDNEFRNTFKGTIEEDKLTGVLSGERGDSDVTGQRAPRMRRNTGIWELKYTIGDRDITSTLILKADDEGELKAEWKNDQAPSTISNLNYQRGIITFDRKTKMGDKELDSTFEGTIDRRTGDLTGTIKSDKGSLSAKGTRIGGVVIGIWNLDITTDRGTVQQRLVVNPDLSGLYGTMKLDAVKLDGDTMSFKITWEFDQRTFEMKFKGKVTDNKLTGEITSDHGTQKVEGAKQQRRMPRGRMNRPMQD